MAISRNQLIETNDPVKQHELLYQLAYHDQKMKHRRFLFFGYMIGIIAMIFPPMSLVIGVPYLKAKFNIRRKKFSVLEQVVKDMPEKQKILSSERQFIKLKNGVTIAAVIFFAIVPIYSGIAVIFNMLKKLMSVRQQKDIIVKVKKSSMEFKSFYKTLLNKVSKENVLLETEKVIWTKVPGKPKKISIEDHFFMDKAQQQRHDIILDFSSVCTSSVKCKKVLKEDSSLSPSLLSNRVFIPDLLSKGQAFFVAVKSKFFSDSQQKSIRLVKELENRYGLTN